MWPRLKLGYNSRLKHKSYQLLVLCTCDNVPPAKKIKKISKTLFPPPLSISEVHLPPPKKNKIKLN